MLCRHFECMFRIEITNNKINRINNLILFINEHRTRYAAYDMIWKRVYVCQILSHRYYTLYLMGVSVRWAFAQAIHSHMPLFIVYTQYMLTEDVDQHWANSISKNKDRKNRIGFQKKFHRGNFAHTKFTPALITILLPQTHTIFVGKQIFHSVTLVTVTCMSCHSCHSPPDSNFYGNNVLKTQCGTPGINCTSPLL